MKIKTILLIFLCFLLLFSSCLVTKQEKLGGKFKKFTGKITVAPGNDSIEIAPGKYVVFDRERFMSDTIRK
jgi:hypothetical protein